MHADFRPGRSDTPLHAGTTVSVSWSFNNTGVHVKQGETAAMFGGYEFHQSRVFGKKNNKRGAKIPNQGLPYDFRKPRDLSKGAPQVGEIRG
jgi:hypothetical protein